MRRQIYNKEEYAWFLQADAERTLARLYAKYKVTPPCTVDDALNHFNNGGSVVVRIRGHNVLYAKRWYSVGYTEAVLTSAIQESDSFNCVGEILC